MRKVLNMTASMVLILSSSFAIEVEFVELDSSANISIIEPMATSSIEITKVKIKDSGVESFVLVPDTSSNSVGTLSPNLDDKLNSKDGLMVLFVDDKDIKSFENMFEIRVKEKLKSGFYIFENRSSLSDVQLIEAILQSDIEDNLKTVRPNWKMGVVKF